MFRKYFRLFLLLCEVSKIKGHIILFRTKNDISIKLNSIFARFILTIPMTSIAKPFSSRSDCKNMNPNYHTRLYGSWIPAPMEQLS